VANDQKERAVMNGRERFAKALSLTELPDRVPVAPPFQGYWALDAFGVTIPESIAHPEKAVEAIVKAQDACPFDALEVVGTGSPFSTSWGSSPGSPMQAVPSSSRTRSSRSTRWSTSFPWTRAATSA